MFKKFLSKVGIGASKLETYFDEDSITPGGEISGRVEIKGGNVEQTIDSLDIFLKLSVAGEDEEDPGYYTTLAEYNIANDIHVEEGSEHEFEFTIPIPADTPLTIDGTKVYFSTQGDVDNALDRRDVDYVRVNPHPLVQATFDALHLIGIELGEIDYEKRPMQVSGRFPIVQEFEFKAKGGPFYGRLEELEIIFVQHDESVEFYMEVDRQERGWAIFETPDALLHFEVSYDHVEDIDNFAEQLGGLIDSNL